VLADGSDVPVGSVVQVDAAARTTSATAV